MQRADGGSLPGWKPSQLRSEGERHMLMLIPITAESKAEDGMCFLLPLLLGEHLRTENLQSTTPDFFFIMPSGPPTCLDVSV